MTRITINGSELRVDRGGEGDPVVLVHGSWSGHAVWLNVANDLRTRFDVTAYDRLGHAESDRPNVFYSRRRHENDLIGLIEQLDLGPVHLVGSSYGAVVSLAVASRRFDLVRSVVAHEPPLLDLSSRPEAAAAKEALKAVARRIESGDVADGTKSFFEELALGPGGWDQLPDFFHRLALDNATTYAAEMRDPDWAAIAPSALEAFPGHVALTEGDQSPAWFGVAMEAVVAAMPRATRITVKGAGHGPHTTHPAEYAAIVAEQLSAGGAPIAAGSLRASA